MKTFQICNFEIILKLTNNKILIELIDLVTNNILKKEYNKEQIIVDIINPLYIKEINSLKYSDLNINEIYNLCNDDKSEYFKEYDLVQDLNENFFENIENIENIENKHNKLSIIKNKNSIKLLFNCEISTIIQLNIIFDFNIIEDDINITEDDINITEDDINIIKDDINITEDDINIIEDDINITEDDINIIKYDINIIRDNIKKYDNSLIPDITINNIIFTLIIVGCVNNVIKNFIKK